MHSQSNQQPHLVAVIGLGAVAFLAFFGFMVVVFKLGDVLGLGTNGYVLAYAICALGLGVIAITIGVVLGKMLRRMDHGARNPRN